jgi:hypothetical protein
MPPRITDLDPPGRRALVLVIAVFLVLDPIIVAVVMLAVGVPWPVIALMAGLILLLPPLVIALAMRLIWTPVARRHPARPILDGAVRQSFQSVSFGPFRRLNSCMIITADDAGLHLEPMPPFAWLGSGRASIPWNQLEELRPSRLGGTMTARVNGRAITGPAWAMQLAAPPRAGAPSDPAS